MKKQNQKQKNNVLSLMYIFLYILSKRMEGNQLLRKLNSFY